MLSFQHIERLSACIWYVPLFESPCVAKVNPVAEKSQPFVQTKHNFLKQVATWQNLY